MTEKQPKKALNIFVSPEAREDLRSLAEANGLSISRLVWFLSLKAMDNPENFGLRPSPKGLALDVHLN